MTTTLGRQALAPLADIREALALDDGDAGILSLIANQVAEEMQSITGRRFVFQGEVEDADGLKDGAAWEDGAVGGVAELSDNRAIIVTLSASTLIGTLTVSGTDPNGDSIAEEFNAADGVTQYGRRVFQIGTTPTVTIASATGSGTVDVGTVEPYTEYHSLDTRRHVLYFRERPTTELVGIWEDASRTWASSAKLTLDTDYALFKKASKATRHTAGLQTDFPEDVAVRFPERMPAWYIGDRIQRVIYAAGWRQTAVPGEIRGLFFTGVGNLYRQAKKSQQGVTSITDASGSVTRLNPSLFSKEDTKRLIRLRTYSETAEE